MDLFSLVAKLTLDKSQYDQGLDDASSGAKSFAEKLKSGLGTAAKATVAAVAAVTTAAVGMTTALVKGAGDVAAFGDNIDKASQKIGFSAEAYQEWDAVLQHSGSSIENLGLSLKTLSAKAMSGSKAFEALGISQKEAASMTREQLFERTITALQGVSNESQRAALASELLGRGAMELGPLLNTSAADTEAMRNRVHELGGVMSNEAVKAAAAYQDSLQDMTTAFDGLKRNMLAEFLPGITTVMDGLTELFSGGDGIEKINDGINKFVNKLSDVLPRVLKTGSRIVLALADAIIDNLPLLIRAAVDAIMTLAKGLIKNLDKLVKAGLQIVLELTKAITQALPELIPAVVQAIITIVDTLTDPEYLSLLIDAAIQIMIALVNGLVDALPRLIEAAPMIVLNLSNAIIRNAPKLLAAGGKLIAALGQGIIRAVGDLFNAVQYVLDNAAEPIWAMLRNARNWGSDLIENFIAGINSMWESLKRKVSDVGGLIKSYLGFSEPEQGPLSNFHTYAPDMMKLFAQGIKDNEHLISDQIGKSFDFGPQMPEPNGSAFIPSSRQPAQKPIQIVFMIDGVQRWVYNATQAEQQRVGVKLATGGAY